MVGSLMALGGAISGCVGIAEFWVIVFGASYGDSASTGDGVTFAESVECAKVASRGAAFVAESTGTTISAVFGIVAVVALVVSTSVTDDTLSIGSKNALSLCSGTLTARPFFFGIGASLLAACFLLCSDSEIAS